MINTDLRLYDYFTFGDDDGYGMPALSTEPKGAIKMAVQDISLKGIENLKTLQQDLRKFSTEIEQAGTDLMNVVTRLEELGTFEETIIELVNEVKKAYEPGQEAVENLVKGLDKAIEKIEDLLHYFE